jgi:hypothetical protein
METIATTIRGRRLSPSRLVAIADRLEKDVAASAIPGATIVIGSHSRVIFERTVGFRDVANGDPLRPDAIWRIYSMTKPIVTAAAMVLVEAGLLCCDQRVADFIPPFARLRMVLVESPRHVAVLDGQGHAKKGSSRASGAALVCIPGRSQRGSLIYRDEGIQIGVHLGAL